MKQLNLYEENDFSEKAFKKLLVHDSPYFLRSSILTSKPGRSFRFTATKLKVNSVLLSLREKESFWEKTTRRCRRKPVMW